MFCSDECFVKATNLFHKIECPLLSLLIRLDMGKNAVLAFRLITQTQLSELKENVLSYKKLSQDSYHLGFNEQNIYSSSDYCTIYHLVTNQNQRTVSDLFKRATMAACLVKLLLLTDYFGRSFNNLCEIEPQTLLDVIFIGKIFFLHLMNLPCNAHSLTELHVNADKYQESHVEEIGAGAFGVFSLTNHSCNPTLARSCYKNTLVAKAIHFIPKGAEISDSYGEHFAIRGREERQKYLHQQYYFVCSCEPCTQNWPTYDALPNGLYFKCPNCRSSVNLDANKCIKCKKNISELIFALSANDNQNMNLLFGMIQGAVNNYNSAYQKVLKGNVSDEISQHIVDVIFWISKYAMLPNKLLFEAQETLKHCFDRKGSHTFI